MFHCGHARYLKQAKNIFPNSHIIFGVSGSHKTHELKGQTSIFQGEGLECVRQSRYVDEVSCPSRSPWFVADINQPSKYAKPFLLTNKINSLIAGFVQYFYAPIRDRIIEYMSTVIPELTNNNNSDNKVFEKKYHNLSTVPNSNITSVMDDKIRWLCNLYLGWDEDQIRVEPLGKGCTNHVIIASIESNEWSNEVRDRNLSRYRDKGHIMLKNDLVKIEDGHIELYKEFSGLNNNLRRHCINQEGFDKKFDNNYGEKAQKRVLIKLYGSVIPRKLAADVYVNCYLGSVGLVPKILGLFEGGRIEEYLPSTCITHDNFRLQYRKIMKMIMNVHNLSMPVPREIFLVKHIHEMSRRVTEDKTMWIAEADWFMEVLEKIGSNMHLAFCHNDVSMNNLLVPHSDPDSLVLIDWEYAAYNYTLFDIANFCCQHQYDLSNPVAPNFIFNEKWLLCDADLLDVLRIYKTSSCIETPYMDLLKQLKFMIMGSELFWTLWALTLEVSFNIDLKDYLTAKRDSYFRKKELYAEVIAELIQDSSDKVVNTLQLDNELIS